MRVLINLFVLAALLLTDISCTRKGEGDPLISLRTRKARLSGEWKITSGHGISALYSNTTGALSEIAWTYSNGRQIFDSPDILSREFTIEIEFRKGGTYRWIREEKNNVNGEISTIYDLGRWNFKAGVDDSERKEEIILQSETYQLNNVLNGYNNLYEVKEYKIHTLRKDKIILKRSYDPYLTISSSGFINTEELTLEPR